MIVHFIERGISFTMKSPQTSTAVNAMKPVAASGGSIVANFDVLDDGEDAAGRTGARLLNLAIAALGLGIIGALAFAWSNADGRLRFELQSAATAPKSAQRAAAPQEIERLRGNSTRRRTTSRSSRKRSIRRRIPSRR